MFQKFLKIKKQSSLGVYNEDIYGSNSFSLVVTIEL